MKKTVFISSTAEDLGPYRRAVWNVLEDLEVNVRGMEQFGARTEAPLETCLAEVDGSDIYVGIIAFRLGTVDESTGKSYTQLEYERARQLDKEILIYLMDSKNAKVAPEFIDRDTFRSTRLDTFKRLLKENHTVDTFVSPDDLAQKLQRSVGSYVEPKQPSAEEVKGEFERTASLLDEFLLIPKAVAGREVRLEVRLAGRPFPASRGICSAFNWEFGATVGLKVQITKPEGYDHSGVEELYLSAEQARHFLPVDEGEKRDIYAQLQFADAKLTGSRARFRPMVEYVLPLASRSFEHLQANLLGGTHRVEPEATLTLRLTGAPAA